MKLWLVPMAELDDKRLTAQHKEYHVIYNKISAEQKWLGWEMVQHREALVLFHDQIHTEWYERYGESKPFVCGGLQNYGNDMTIICQNEQKYYSDPLHRPYYTVDYDRWTLICRWNGKYKGRDNLDRSRGLIYSYYIKIYHEQGGCLHDGRWIKGKGGHEYCLLCKRVERIKKPDFHRDNDDPKNPLIFGTHYEYQQYSPWSRK